MTHEADIMIRLVDALASVICNIVMINLCRFLHSKSLHSLLSTIDTNLVIRIRNIYDVNLMNAGKSVECFRVANVID